MIVMVEVAIAVLTIMLILNTQESRRKMARAQAAITPNLPDKNEISADISIPTSLESLSVNVSFVKCGCLKTDIPTHLSYHGLWTFS